MTLPRTLARTHCYPTALPSAHLCNRYQGATHGATCQPCVHLCNLSRARRSPMLLPSLCCYCLGHVAIAMFMLEGGGRALGRPVTVTEGPQKIFFQNQTSPSEKFFFNIQTKTHDVECLT